MAEEAQPQTSTPPSGHSSASGQSSSSANPTQAMDTSGLLHGSSHSASQIPPVAGSVQNQETIGRGQGLYAVQCSPFIGMMPEFPPSMLIPLTYKIPTRTNSDGEEQGQGRDAVRQQPGLQRQVVVRRFHVAIQLDLALLLKLAFVVILFGQDGSRQRTMVLILLATLVYLYQTGVLTPLIRYARRELAPPRPVARPQNAGRQNIAEGNGGDENQNQPAEGEHQNQPAEGNGGDENQNQPAEGEQPPEPERANGLNLWRIAREIQTFIIGFITSLLPGFEQHND